MSLNTLQNEFNICAGGILIATPKTDFDEDFRQSVILLTDFSRGLVSGVIVNKEIDPENPWQSASANLGGPVKNASRLGDICFGGPVDKDWALTALFAPPSAVHGKISLDDPKWAGRIEISGVDIGEKTYYCRKAEDLPRLEMVRCFNGYALWLPENLEREMQAGHWITGEKASPDKIFGSKRYSWEEEIAKYTPAL